jgi:hypothetical protein
LVLIHKASRFRAEPGVILSEALETLKYSRVAIKYPKEEPEENNDGFEE